MRKHRTKDTRRAKIRAKKREIEIYICAESTFFSFWLCVYIYIFLFQWISLSLACLFRTRRPINSAGLTSFGVDVRPFFGLRLFFSVLGVCFDVLKITPLFSVYCSCYCCIIRAPKVCFGSDSPCGIVRWQTKRYRRKVARLESFPNLFFVYF